MSSVRNPDRPPTASAAFWDEARLRQLASPTVTAQDLAALATLLSGVKEQDEALPAEALVVLMASLKANDELSTDGRAAIHLNIIARMINRLRIQRVLKRHPLIQDERIERPLIVTGLPRTGTTLLQRLLAQDPNSRCLPFWEALQPAPSGDWPPRDADPRIDDAAELIAVTSRKNAKMKSVHATDPESPEECTLLLLNSLVYPAFDQYAHVPEYIDWLRQRSLLPTYQYYVRQLQILQFAHRAEHWVLKAPRHRRYLDILLQVLPTAQIVLTQRDPVKSITSACSLRMTTRSAYQDSVDPLAIGRRAMDKIRDFLEESIEAFDRMRRELDTGQFVDVQYADMMRDPIATVRGIYEALGYTYSDAFETRMRQWLAENPQHKHGVHRYTPEQFGLDRHELFELFKPYYEANGIEREPI